MKRIFAIAAFLLLTACILSACNGDTPSVTDQPIGEVTTDAPVTDAPASDDKVVIEEGAYYSFSTEDLFCIGGETFGTVSGENVGVRGYRKNLDQLWYFTKLDDGTYYVQNASSGLYLSVRLKSENDNAPIVLSLQTDNHGQRWTVEKSGDGVVLHCVETDSYIAIKTPNEASVAVQKLSNADATAWKMKKELDAGTELPEILRLEGDYMAPASCPEIIKYNGAYYNINMTGGMKIKMSTDLITWKNVGTVFATKPSWIKAEIGSDSIWAPGFYMVGGKLRIYYCASSSGSRDSLIGLVDCNNPRGGYVDRGMVIRSYAKGTAEETPYNCIDPNIFVDDDGQTYLIWGSYAEGIYMRRIDENTGKFIEGDNEMWKLADAPDGMEAPYLVKRGDYYYLFVAMGNMSKNENYHWAVGRSESLFGPFVDKKGRSMLEGYTFALTEYKPGVQATAHAQPFLDDDGTWYMVSEMWMDRSDPDKKIQLHISKMVWNDEGWPVTALATNLVDEILGKK
ncbi:MAG: family 43 glycosylhydrolase [Clostridia bacterium]|nr:family 43 glycosylhydrolase [Clostridia bacterium]